MGACTSKVCAEPVGVPGFERDLRKKSKNVGVVGGRATFLAFAKSDEEGFECAGGRK
jgi:hypothetical protein